MSEAEIRSRNQKSIATTMAEAEIDRLSQLPCEILVNILSFLPSKEAVATCALAKRWVYLHFRVTTLFLSDKNVTEEEFGRVLTKFLSSKVLKSCMLESVKQKYPVNILECFISTLVNHNALQFISLKMSPKFYLMRTSVMKCKSLVELHFDNLWIEKQVDADSLPSLRKLFLNNVRFYTTSILVSIINVSRGLEQLTLIKPHVISSACDVELSNLM
jgi:hypothetical protein